MRGDLESKPAPQKAPPIVIIDCCISNVRYGENDCADVGAVPQSGTNDNSPPFQTGVPATRGFRVVGWQTAGRLADYT